MSFLLCGCGYKEVKVDNKFINNLSEKYNSGSTDLKTQNLYIQQYSNWYASFNTGELQDLIFLALNNNLEITKALYNLQASSLQLGEYRQALFPSLSFQSQYLRENYSKAAIKHLGGKTVNTFSTMGLTASYELDFWGKNYSSYKGAKNKINASKAEYDGIKVTIIANIMNLWVNLMALREEIVLLNNKVHDIESILDIQEANYSNGAITITDLFQQQGLLLETQKHLKDIQYAELETLRSINILLGRDPLDKLVITSSRLPQLPTLPDEQMNIIVLANRPDIKAAFYNLLASKWDAKVANLSRLPSFSLQSLADVGSAGLAVHFNAWLIKNILQASVPLFQAGALLNKEHAMKLLTKANVVNYKQVVFNAISEVKNALDNEAKYIEGKHNIIKQLELMEETKTQLQNKYLNGETNYLEYLNASSKVIDLKIALIEQQKDLLLNRILFYRALGITVEDKER